MYYNTNKLSGNDLKEATAKNLSQNQIVLAAFRKYPGAKLSPDFIWQRVFNQSIPITSVRRSLSTLTKAGRLRKTDSMSIGFYGAPVHRWELI